MFCIDQENCIRWGNTCDGDHFSSLKSFAEIAKERQWGKAEVTALWNSFAGAVPFDELKEQKCFKNVGYGLGRIWWAIQRLAPEGERQVEPVESVEGVTADEESKVEPREVEEEKPVKEKKKRAVKAPKIKAEKAKRGESTKDKACQLLLRKSGATAADFEERLGWSNVSVALFIQWVQLVTRNGLKTLEIEKRSNGERVYRAAA